MPVPPIAVELPEEIVNLLTDEAYLSLSREAVQGALVRAGQEKTTVASSRPPFGIHATKSGRRSYEQSMSLALTTEAALTARLERITVLESALRRRLRPAVQSHLGFIAPQYAQREELLAAVQDWEGLLDGYHEQTQAFSRELRLAIGLMNSPETAAPELAGERLSTLAALHQAAGGVDSAAWRLEEADRRLTAASGTYFATIQIGPPPLIHQVAWVERVAAQPDHLLVAELGRTEAMAHGLVNIRLAPLHAHAAAARAKIEGEAEKYLEAHWAQLRRHALTYFVQERDVDEVLDLVTEHLLTVDSQRQRERLAPADDPYLGER